MIAAEAGVVAGVEDAVEPKIGLEQYYEEAGPDYAAWSREFNMHFGFWRWGMNPLDREGMLEQMNGEVLARLGVGDGAKLLDLGCGLGATLRSFARRMPKSTLVGVTRVGWQVERATELNRAAGLGDRVRVLEGDYEDTILPRGSYDGVYALESSCHAHGADKGALLSEAHRLLKKGGRMVVADGFLTGAGFGFGWQEKVYRKLCECWVIEELGKLDLFVAKMEEVGFRDVRVERVQMRVAASVAHVPWVTVRFLWEEVVRGRGEMTRARWNNVVAPVLLPWVSWPVGGMEYCVVTGVKG